MIIKAVTMMLVITRATCNIAELVLCPIVFILKSVLLASMFFIEMTAMMLLAACAMMQYHRLFPHSNTYPKNAPNSKRGINPKNWKCMKLNTVAATHTDTCRFMRVECNMF